MRIVNISCREIATFIAVKTTATCVPNFRAATHIIVTTTTAPTAISLIAHCGMSSGDTSARVLCHIILLRYSENMRLMTALAPGFFSY